MLFPLPILLTGLLAPIEDHLVSRPFQPLHIPEAVSGTEFILNLHQTAKSFWTGATTQTYAYDNEQFWGPTLIMNKGDQVQIHVKNELDETTTNHWHSMRIPAIMDGGPHQVVSPTVVDAV